jgi:hypothetical protein
VTRSTTFISASAEMIRSRIATPKTWPEWQSEILSTEQPRWAEPHEVVHGQARLLGFDVHGRSLTISSEPSAFEQDVVVGVRMHVRYSIEEGSTGCRVTHELKADLPGGLSGRVLSFLLARRLRKMQVDLLGRLKDQLEELA